MDDLVLLNLLLLLAVPEQRVLLSLCEPLEVVHWLACLLLLSQFLRILLLCHLVESPRHTQLVDVRG